MTLRRRIVFIAIAFVVVAVSVIVFMLRSPDSRPSGELHDILMLQNSQISSFDPLDAYHAGHIQMVRQLYNTLVDIDLNGKVVPSVAKEWTTTDGLTWRINLRDDVPFHADPCFTRDLPRRITAEDVVFTFNRLLSPKSTSMGVSYFTNIKGATEYHAGTADIISGLKIIDAYVIEIELESVDYGFPARLTLPYVSIVPAEALKVYGAGFAQHPVGTGPFRLERYETNTLVSLVRNPDYWEHGLPALERIKVYLVADENRAMQMFRNQEADFLELSRPLYEQYRRMKFSFDVTTAVQENAQFNMYLCNLNTVKETDVRRGLSLALDRVGLEDVISQEGTIAKSLFPPGIFPLLTTTDVQLRTDVEAARQLLVGLGQIRLVCFEDAMSRAMADRYAQSLKEVGVRVQVEAVPFPVLIERLTSGGYDLIQLYWGPLYADPAHYLTPFLTHSFPPNGNNFNHYSNPEVDQAVAQSYAVAGDNATQAFLRAQNLILTDMPFVPLYFKTTTRASNQRFEMPLHPLQYRLYKLSRPKVTM